MGGPERCTARRKGVASPSASGRQAHGAHVHAGENAADKLIDALIDLRQLETLTPVEPARRGVNIIEAAAGFRRCRWATAARQTMQRLTVNLGGIERRNFVQSYPASATAVDIPNTARPRQLMFR
jgi:succinyl-diaminopimelate desuccinylase